MSGRAPDRTGQPNNRVAASKLKRDQEENMSRLRLHSEQHLVNRIGWLRAAVLGANDGIVSTASLIVGVAAAAATQNDVLIAGVAGLGAGAMSMAAGEYVSVSSQSDTEQADIARERKELSEAPEAELEELAQIYVKRGVDRAVALQVAQQLMAKDALTAHARDELGISEITTARPVQVALTSAATFSVGAACRCSWLSYRPSASWSRSRLRNIACVRCNPKRHCHGRYLQSPSCRRPSPQRLPQRHDPYSHFRSWIHGIGIRRRDRAQDSGCL
jgi:vacuolar iron transporter family protein